MFDEYSILRYKTAAEDQFSRCLNVEYTVWRKKNECFSNNCNFVYFQY